MLQHRLSEKGINQGEFNSILVKLEQDKKLIYVSRNMDDVRFVDPLLAPFLRNLMGLSRQSNVIDGNSIKITLDSDD
jgi:hypothetical protein